MADNRKELLQETIQEVTLTAWPIMYGDNNPFDLDSRMVLGQIRMWAREFEEQWADQPDDMDSDYLLAVEAFAEKKAKEFMADNVEEYAEHLMRSSGEFMGEAVDGWALDIKIRDLIDPGTVVDLRGALDESTVLCVEGMTVPRDFFVDSVIRATGGVILFGYWDDPVTGDQAWDSILLANNRYFPKHSDNLEEALQDALAVIIKT